LLAGISRAFSDNSCNMVRLEEFLTTSAIRNDRRAVFMSLCHDFDKNSENFEPNSRLS